MSWQAYEIGFTCDSVILDCDTMETWAAQSRAHIIVVVDISLASACNAAEMPAYVSQEALQHSQHCKGIPGSNS